MFITHFPMNLQFFAEGDGVSGGAGAGADPAAGGVQTQEPQLTGMQQLNNLLGTMNQQGGDSNTQGQPPAQGQQTEPQTQPAGVPQQQQQPPAQNTETQAQKDAQAFAAMRVRNKQYEEMLDKIARATGIQYSNPEEMIQKLNDDALTKLAQQQNVPVELLRRLETLEANNKAYLAMQNQTRLTNEFAALRDKYSLDETALATFAQQLEADKVDPATVNVEREYIARNLDAIVAARVQAAVQQALTRDANATAHGTTPTAVQSNTPSGADQQTISTAADLNRLLASMPK